VDKVRWVTQAQVDAAKLIVEMDLEDGREPDPVAVKIANAKPAVRPRGADGKPVPEYWENPEYRDDDDQRAG
jgi:hypothetical protein